MSTRGAVLGGFSLCGIVPAWKENCESAVEERTTCQDAPEAVFD